MSPAAERPPATRRERLRWPAAIVLGGVAAGLIGAAMAWLLLEVQALAYGVRTTSLLVDVQTAPPVRRVLAPAIGGLLAGLAWWHLRRSGAPLDVTQGMRIPGRMGLWRPFLDSGLQILVVGAGASIGREGAPRLAAGSVADTLAARLRLDAAQSRIVIASAAGAGLAAVYNVPLAGAAFALELLLVWRPWRAAVAAVPMSAIATIVAWPVVTARPTYAFPQVQWQPVQLLWTLLAIPLTAALGLAFDAMAGWAANHRPEPTWRLPLAMMAGGAVVGVASIWLPMLPGNGKDLVQVAFDGKATLLTFALLLALKPLVTSVCLWSGMRGGLLTPALATGAALGTIVALGVQTGGGTASVPVFVLIGACGVLAVTQRAPLFAALMTWELTRAPWWTIPLLLAVAFGSAAVARWFTSRTRGRSRSASATVERP